MAGHEVPKVIVFSHDADLTLRMLKYPQPLKPNDDGGDKMKSTTDFQVDRQVLINTSDSKFSSTLLTSNAWAESGKSLVTLKEHNSASVEVILCSVYSRANMEIFLQRSTHHCANAAASCKDSLGCDCFQSPLHDTLPRYRRLVQRLV